MTQTYKVQVSMNQAHIVESGFVWKQGDFGFNIEIEVLDFDTTGATPQIIFRKSTGAVEATQISVAGNKFTYAIRGTELDTPGPCVCDLKLNDSTTKRVSTASFKYFVIPDTMDGLEQEASSYSDTIAQIVGGFDGDINLLNEQIKYLGDDQAKKTGDLKWGAVIDSITPSYVDLKSFVYEIFPIDSLTQKTYLLSKKTEYIPMFSLSLFIGNSLYLNTGFVAYTGNPCINLKQAFLNINPDITQIGITIIYTTDGTTATRVVGGFELSDFMLYRKAFIDDDVINDLTGLSSEYIDTNYTKKTDFNPLSERVTILSKGVNTLEENFNHLAFDQGKKTGNLKWGDVRLSKTPAFVDLKSFVYEIFPIDSLTQKTYLFSKKTEYIPMFALSLFIGDTLLEYTPFVVYAGNACVNLKQAFLNINPNITHVGITIIYTTDGTGQTRVVGGFELSDFMLYRKAFIDDDVINDLTGLSSAYINSHFIKKGMGFVVVAKQNGDYTSISDAINHTSDGDTILVMPGTYEEDIHMFGKNRKIIGFERSSCMVTNGSAAYANPPFEANVGTIRNLTIVADTYDDPNYDPDDHTARSYAVHIDASYSGNHALEISNCTLLSKCGAGVGIGVRFNQTVRLINCTIQTLVDKNWSLGLQQFTPTGALFFHNDSVGTGDNGTLLVKDCTINGVASSICAYSLNNGNLLTCQMIDNTCYATNTGVGANTFLRRNDVTPEGMLCGEDITLSIISHGNNIDDINS